MIKNICLLFVFISLFSNVLARQKKLVSKAIKVTKATFIIKPYDKIDGGESIYTFEIKTNSKNLMIDSVWFGAAPVPCDLYKNVGGFRIDKTNDKGTYLVKANKNLYKIYNSSFDSTQAFKNFKPIIPFDGIAMIMYKENGKRKYQMVENAMLVPEKKRR